MLFERYNIIIALHDIITIMFNTIAYVFIIGNPSIGGLNIDSGSGSGTYVIRKHIKARWPVFFALITPVNVQFCRWSQ